MQTKISAKSLSNYKNFFRDFPGYHIRMTRHADSRKNERGFRFTLPDLRRVLQKGTILHVEFDVRTGAEKFRIAGRDIDGHLMEIVVALDGTNGGCVHVITVIKPVRSIGTGSRS